MEHTRQLFSTPIMPKLPGCMQWITCAACETLLTQLAHLQVSLLDSGDCIFDLLDVLLCEAICHILPTSTCNGSSVMPSGPHCKATLKYWYSETRTHLYCEILTIPHGRRADGSAGLDERWPVLCCSELDASHLCGHPAQSSIVHTSPTVLLSLEQRTCWV